jgi:hypothetical protein
MVRGAHVICCRCFDGVPMVTVRRSEKMWKRCGNKGYRWIHFRSLPPDEDLDFACNARKIRIPVRLGYLHADVAPVLHRRILIED